MTPAPQTAEQTRSSIKETFTSILIALVIAFTVRGFVIEAFVIPTGSMAPTLLGANTRVHSSESGYAWTIGAPMNADQRPMVPPTIEATDIMTGKGVVQTRPQVRAGDRIFVLKYLDGIYEPQRFDVVVFKNPTDPTQNYIKRLTGLPGEMLALVDGDVFTRTPLPTDPADPGDANPWELTGWVCQRKPERAQRAMWQDVHDTRYLAGQGTSASYPWQTLGVGEAGTDWERTPDGGVSYRGKGPAMLEWKDRNRLCDAYTYNTLTPREEHFPVSDLRLTLFGTPRSEGVSLTAALVARKHEFEVIATGATVTARMRESNAGSVVGQAPVVRGEWQTLATWACEPLRVGSPTSIDVWFVDQSIRAFQGTTALGEPVLLEWSLAERIARSTRYNAETAFQSPRVLLERGQTIQPQIVWRIEGGAIDIHRLRVQRDIFYRPTLMPTWTTGPTGRPLKSDVVAGHATSPQSTMRLKQTQYFVCGDNSPQSLDGRGWGPPDPLVGALDPTPGVVTRELMIGQAFYVYFPAWTKRFGLPIPDVGRMRWIW